MRKLPIVLSLFIKERHPAALQSSATFRAQSGYMGRAREPDSPPMMSQSRDQPERIRNTPVALVFVAIVMPNIIFKVQAR